MILHPNPVTADKLLWIPEDRRFVAEMSDIGGFGLVYDDACDEGLTLVSRRPGYREIVFAVEHEERREGDTLYWDLKPADGKTCGFTVRIFND